LSELYGMVFSMNELWSHLSCIYIIIECR